ncbi:glucose-1-phosphate cytidylyltransferase [Ancylobacter oerskovii]|uniref:Glucose-1-phosphate cytidylyltransferase n=1 Tax=Ancylobacter oerskovii TaxID=459519 RepID=A0ABW4Z0X9_9HYPH|nr:glucose-1-phosphate cytidylyltransferase [Ancylobacter oerskovii]MBS7542931.1 glucose-1-phosphate cytidylyltransferase [Ancylobacter oerskovii]
MKVVILAGGKGIRHAEETSVRPKSMVEIGGWPVLWHILNLYSVHGLNDFIICCDQKNSTIKDFFANYALRRADVTFDFANGSIGYHVNAIEPWRVTLVDTGEETMTGGRLKRAAKYLDGDTFCCAYGDSLCDVDIGRLIRFHTASSTLATLVAVQPPGRLVGCRSDDARAGDPREGTCSDDVWVNGGFFVLQPEVLSYIDDDATVWEQAPMQRLGEEGQLTAFRHAGFWHPVETLRDILNLQEIWNSGKAPWRVEALRAAQGAAASEHDAMS